ncbi:hypothetical protein U1Q18_052317, partial [Sarracenia purpurea var. burkii]
MTTDAATTVEIFPNFGSFQDIAKERSNGFALADSDTIIRVDVDWQCAKREVEGSRDGVADVKRTDYSDQELSSINGCKEFGELHMTKCKRVRWTET